MRPASPDPQRTGYTVVELLVTLSVIGLLLALLMPAVQAARETARRAQCRSHLKQLALAIHNHESAFGRLPGNGWGFQWIGEPDRGTGPDQPGGWIYQLLPFIEQDGLRKLGAGLPDYERRDALARLTQSHLPLLRCPTRPAPTAPPRNPLMFWRNADHLPTEPRTDYAVNEGDFVTDTDGGPLSLAEGDSQTYPWKDTSRASGVCFLRSTVRMADLTDGSSHTYLLGEKHVQRAHYADAGDPGYDQNPFTGVDLDLNRWTHVPPHPDGDAPHERAFGSAHSAAFHMALGDGSVRTISYSIDAVIHRTLGHRHDSGPRGEF